MRAIRTIEVLDADLRRANTTDMVRVFDGLAAVPAQARAVRGTLVLGFPTFDRDPRPNWAIPEIRAYVQALDAALPHFLYFITDEPAYEQVVSYMYCVTPGAEGGHPATGDLLTAALGRADAVRAFAARMDDNADRVGNGVLLNLPAEIAADDPALSSQMLARMNWTLRTLDTGLAEGRFQAPDERALVARLLGRAARLAALDVAGYRDARTLIAALRRIVVPPVDDDTLRAFDAALFAGAEHHAGQLRWRPAFLRGLVHQHRAAAYRFVEHYVALAAGQPGHLRPAAVVGLLLEEEFGDPGPMRDIEERAEDLGVSRTVWDPTAPGEGARPDG